MVSKHDWHWTFGKHCHIEFAGGGAPTVALDQAFDSHEGSAAVSDGNGNLLFYTDGDTLYDSAHVPIASGLGGSTSSSHSAIIVPPAGGGSLYHIFAVYEWEGAPWSLKPLTHTSVQVSGSTVLVASPPTPLTAFGPQPSSERLAAVPHADCGKYWVIALYVDAPKIEAEGPGVLHAMLVDSDAGVSQEVLTPYPWPDAWFGLCCKFSPDGSLIAMTSRKTIDIMYFDRATGKFTPHSQILDDSGDDFTWGSPYGVEFSPNGQYLYFTVYFRGDIRRHTLIPNMVATPYSATALLGTWPVDGRGPFNVGALQLGPNGKIYGTKVGQKELFEIGLPDSAIATGAAVQLNMTATTVGGAPLLLNDTADLGLPTFVRMTRDCDDTCASLAAEVDKLLDGRELHNSMVTCKGEKPEDPQCAPLDIPPIVPQTYVRWGSGPCDCIEGDDTEVMHLTICNPCKNLTLSNLTVQQLLVVDASGNPVPLLPDGSPSIQLVPIGPYCFDDIAPCTCVTREFMLRLRGAPGGKYRILVRGICFDACFHGDTEACFAFDVCKD